MPRGVKATKPNPSSVKRKPGRPPTPKTKKPGRKVATAPAPIRKPGRPPGKAAKPAVKAAAPKVSRNATAPNPQSAKTPAAPKLSVAELRARVEKLERTVATLREKGRAAGKAARTSAALIAELEDQVAQFERMQAAATKIRMAAGKAKPERRGRRIDPGDAMPTDVAVEKPAPVDEEAEIARENLEQNRDGE